MMDDAIIAIQMIVAGGFGLAAAALLLLTSAIIVFDLSFRRRAMQAMGTVIGYVTSKMGCQRPLVRFNPSVAEDVEFRANFGSNPPPFRVGETVLVLYEPANPRNARIQCFRSQWLFTLILLGMAVLFGTISGALLWSAWHSVTA